MVDSDRDFAFEATFIVDHPSFAQFRSGKPPLHFHPHQEEYISVVEGVIALEVEGREYILGPDDGEFLVKPWIIHRLYTVSASSRGEQESDSNIVRFKSAGQKTPEVLKLDLLLICIYCCYLVVLLTHSLYVYYSLLLIYMIISVTTSTSTGVTISVLPTHLALIFLANY